MTTLVPAVPIVEALKALRFAEVSPTQMVLPESLTYERWELIGEAIKLFRSASKWWIGDWIIHGEATFGEKYGQAVDETGYEIGYLRNIVSTCSRVAPSRRREDLSFGHHMEIAKCAPRDQRHWLSVAAKEQLSQRALRERVREEEAFSSTTTDASSNRDGQGSAAPSASSSHPSTDGAASNTGSGSRSLPTSYIIPGPIARRLIDEGVPTRDGFVKVPRDLIDRLRGIVTHD